MRSPGLLDADAGQAYAFQGWADTDAVLRLMLRQPVEYTTIPVRLFSRANVGGLALTPAAEESGGWLGPQDYVGTTNGCGGRLAIRGPGHPAPTLGARLGAAQAVSWKWAGGIFLTRAESPIPRSGKGRHVPPGAHSWPPQKVS
jgi:hypothetical protein